MKTNTNTTTRANTEELYNTAEKAVYIALRARHEKSGLNFLAELQNGQATDRRARANTTIANQLATLEEEHDQLTARLEEIRTEKARADRQAESLKNNEETRKAYIIYSRQLDRQAQPIKNRITSLTQDINSLYDRLQITFTDRADLTQTALLRILELEQTPAPITTTVLSSYGVETVEELTAEERATAQEQANFRAIINTVGKAINNLATPEAHNRYTTKAEKITDLNEVTEFILKYGGIGKDYKAPHTAKRSRVSDCYITIEERNTKTQQGFYKITHYRTVAPYQYIADFTEGNEESGEETDIAYLKITSPIVNTFEDVVNITDFYSKANLTDLERLILNYYQSAMRYYDTQADIINYICCSAKISRATYYRRWADITAKLEPIAKEHKLIK